MDQLIATLALPAIVAFALAAAGQVLSEMRGGSSNL